MRWCGRYYSGRIQRKDVEGREGELGKKEGGPETQIR